MWQTKKFENLVEMKNWIKKRIMNIEYTEIFIQNGRAIEWRKLRKR